MNTSPIAVPFDSVSVPVAKRIKDAHEVLPAHVRGLALVGEWSTMNRRFCLVRLSAANSSVAEDASVTKDLDNGILTFSREFLESARLDRIVSEMRSFGAMVARFTQSKNPGFEIVEGFDREFHSLPKYHHVALCGHRGPWADPASAAEGVSVTCSSCSDIAKTKPKHRARFHPLTESSAARG